jgi:hypothetical protein
MICEACEGEGYRCGVDPQNPGALVMLPCLECNGSGIANWGAIVYRDDTFDERKCDYCGKLYRGPAVYCSLECATDDL